MIYDSNNEFHIEVVDKNGVLIEKYTLTEEYLDERFNEWMEFSKKQSIEISEKGVGFFEQMLLDKKIRQKNTRVKLSQKQINHG